ncbi:MAG: PilW family protein [Magnetococcus sp. MYC-9]
MRSGVPGCRAGERDRGFSLLELMVALTIGLLLVSGLLGIFSSTKQTYLLNENIARLQENARFAMETLVREIRMAGYWGCVSDLPPGNQLVTPHGLSWALNERIRGYDNSNQAALPPVLQGKALPGTDAIVVSGIDPKAMTIESHNACTAQFKTALGHDVQTNEILFVTDCTQGVIFQVTQASQVNRTLDHQTGSGSIGNVSACLGGDCSGACASAWYQYGPNAMLSRIRSVAFFIGTGASGEPALFWEILNQGSGTTGIELVDGVENLQLLYGWDTDADQVANQYLTAAAVEAANAWSSIVSVRVGLLLRTADGVRSQLDQTPYTVAGTPIQVSGSTVTHPADFRIRKVVTSTLQLRH